MALLQQHDARRHILIEPAARRRPAIEAVFAPSSECPQFRMPPSFDRWKLGGIPNWGHSELGAQSGRKNEPACAMPCRRSLTVLVYQRANTDAIQIKTVEEVLDAFLDVRRHVRGTFHLEHALSHVLHNR